MRFYRRLLAGSVIFLLVWAVGLAVLLLSGCTSKIIPTKLDPLVQKNLGRELVVRMDGKVLNPLNTGERLKYGANAEVDVKVNVLGAKMYGHGPLWAQLVAFPLPILSITYLRCAHRKEWKTDTICTCRIEVISGNDDLLNHELMHCKGYIDSYDPTR